MATEEEIEARMEEVAGAISAQGGKVKGLKDQVKALKKAKVRRLCPGTQSCSRGHLMC